MNERTRYRLSGSVFLLALAVIFLPMLFDGKTPAKPDIPPQPEAMPLANVPAYDEVAPASDVEQQVAALREEVDADGFVTETGEKFGQAILSEATDSTTTFAVQAAAFKQLPNARNLRSALREAGLEAFITSAKASASEAPVHRVVVGPLLERTDAESIRSTIESDFALEALIVAMEP